jgi:hypothetical protein
MSVTAEYENENRNDNRNHKLVFGAYPGRYLEEEEEEERGSSGSDGSGGYCFLVDSNDGWILMSGNGSARSHLRVSHGWTRQTAEECARILDGDVI